MKNYVYSRIYKLCRAFSWLIAFFIGGIFFSMTCHAQALPTPSSDTFSTIINGNNSLSFSLFSDVDVLPINPNPVNIYNIIEDVAQDPLVVGAQLNLMQNNDYTVSELTQSEIDNFSQVYPYLYDVNGNTVSWDNVYHLHYMNAMFHGDVYIDSAGNILTSDQNNTKTMFQLGVGGYLLQVSDIANIYDEIAVQLGNHQMLYSLNPNIDVSNNNMNFYVYGGRRGNYNDKVPWYWSQELYLPNIYDRNLYYVYSYGNFKAINCITPTQIWCVNDPTPYLNTVYKQYGNNYPFYTIHQITHTRDGITYNYSIACADSSSFINNSTISTKENFIDDSNLNLQYCILNYNKFNFDRNLEYFEDDVVAFKVLQPKTTKYIQIDDDTYSYDDIKEAEENLNNLTSSPNELFDPDQAVSEENSPVTYPYDEPSVNPSDLPFPSVNTDPDPNPNPDPNIEYDPEVQPTPEEIETSINNFGIPFFQNLQYKYPFSIPWDIKAFINSFKAEPTPPAWDFDWSITVGNTTYTHHFQGDLSEFNSLAEIFRNLLLISFIIGLCVFSYNHHF